jgi:cytosine/adenosine deaminase-related metal-dependent hydrolase
MGMDYRQGSVARAHGVETRTGGRDIRAAHMNCRICILAATIGAAGSLELGRRADFVVLDRNLFEIPSADIHRARVLWTVVEGQEVYRAEDWDERNAPATRFRSAARSTRLNGATAKPR